MQKHSGKRNQRIKYHPPVRPGAYQTKGFMSNIATPTLFLDEQKVRANLQRMVSKAERNNLVLKPHVKTHQSLEVGKWCRESEINKITVSSVKMAEYFSADGWNDITIAFPVNPREIDRLNNLAQKIDLSLLVSDQNIIPILESGINSNVQLYIEIDTGSDRTGYKSEQTDPIQNIISRLADQNHLHFKGFYSHPGHSYSARSAEQILTIQRNAVQQMRELKATFKKYHPGLVCCVGDTPCCSVGEDWDGIDEISPGNFAFYDLMQVEIGSCQPNEIAVVLACPVVAIYPSRNEIAIHGGGIHLSKDRLEHNGLISYGNVVRMSDDFTWSTPVENCYVRSVSQEHGIVTCTDSFMTDVKLGDIIGILPVHSCMTADTMKMYRSCGSFRKIDHLQGAKLTN